MGQWNVGKIGKILFEACLVLNLYFDALHILSLYLC